MKIFKIFFILLIGMINLTALAATPMLDEKQKTTIEMVQAVDYVANVEAVTDVFYKQKVPQKKEFIYKLSKVKNLKAEQALDPDVGWQSKSLKIINNKKNFSVAHCSANQIRAHTK